MNVSVVIPSYGRPSQLRTCITACVDQSPRPIEIIVCLRRCDHQSEAVVAGFGTAPVPVRTALVDDPGHIPPLISGLCVASGDVVAFLDDDAVPRPGWVVSMLELLARGAIAVGGPVVNHPPSQRHRRHLRYGRVSWYGGLVRNAEIAETTSPRRVDFLFGGNAAYRRTLLQGVGFDMELNTGAAINYEADVGLSMGRLGEIVFTPTMIVDHYPAPRRSAPDREDRERYMGDYTRNLYYIAAKHHGPARRVLFRTYMAVVGQAASPGWIRDLARAVGGGTSVGTSRALVARSRAQGWAAGVKARRS